MKSKTIVISSVAVAFAIAVLGYAYFMGDNAYYYEVGDFLSQTVEQQMHNTKVNGTLLSEERDKNSVAFVLTDMNDESLVLNAYYEGSIPDTFKIGNEVVAAGKYDPNTATFIANELIVKCSSKYEPAV
jgi:cytochrome c-type biogenesis protein CcmE